MTQKLKGQTPILKKIIRHLKKYQDFIHLKNKNAPLKAVTRKYKNVFSEKNRFQNIGIILKPEISNLTQKIKKFLAEYPKIKEKKKTTITLEKI